jgi:hypothetical protein
MGQRVHDCTAANSRSPENSAGTGYLSRSPGLALKVGANRETLPGWSSSLGRCLVRSIVSLVAAGVVQQPHIFQTSTSVLNSGEDVFPVPPEALLPQLLVQVKLFEADNPH